MKKIVESHNITLTATRNIQLSGQKESRNKIIKQKTQTYRKLYKKQNIDVELQILTSWNNLAI